MLAGERSCVGDIADVEVGEDADDALLDFGADLLFGEIFLRDGIDGGPDGFDAEQDGRQDKIFSGADDDVFDLPGGEARGGDFDKVFSGRDSEEREGAGDIGLSGRGGFGIVSSRVI